MSKPLSDAINRNACKKLTNYLSNVFYSPKIARKFSPAHTPNDHQKPLPITMGWGKNFSKLYQCIDEKAGKVKNEGSVASELMTKFYTHFLKLNESSSFKTDENKFKKWCKELSQIFSEIGDRNSLWGREGAPVCIINSRSVFRSWHHANVEIRPQ